MLPAAIDLHRPQLAFATALLLTAAFIAAPSAHAQADTPMPQTLTVKARLVVLDVTVTDAKGQPVSDLTSKDLQVFEDGVLQSIRSLEPPSRNSLPAQASAAGVNEVFDPAHPSNFGSSPVTVLLLDEANTHFADSSYARRQLRAYLTRQAPLLPQPANLLSVYDGRFKELHGFTRDRDALLKALEAAPTQYAWQLEVNGSTQDGPIERLDQSLRVLEQVAQSYARIPGRKNVIWVGGGFPTLDPTMLDGDEDLEVKNTLRRVTDILLDTRVTLYGIDPTSTAAGQTEITSPEQLSFAMAAGDAMTAGTDPFNTTQEFERMALLTGGRVARGRNDVSREIGDAIVAAANSYTLAYAPTSSQEVAAKFRRIRVVCLRPGLTAVTRSGYFPNPNASKETPVAAAYDLSAAVEAAIPLNALKVQATTASGTATLGSSIIVHVRAADLTWKPTGDGSSTASVYILAASMNAKNKMAAHVTEGMKATAKAGTNLQDPTRYADFAINVSRLTQGKHLRIVVRDSASGKMGSVDLAGSER
jgi:VWFA-related protein